MASDYEQVRELGKGSFGTVYLIRHKQEDELFAVKAIEATGDERDSAEKEAQVMSKLDHDHVVRYITSYFKGRTLFIFTEYCEGGDLEHFLQDSTGSLPERLILYWMKQTASALEHLHGKFILHRDLKPANIYLTADGDIKLGDLGIARVLDRPVDMARTYTGTPFYMSPEIFKRMPYNYKTDIWSFGCVVYELSTRVRAFDDINMPFLILKVTQNKVPPIGDEYSAPLRELVKSMMCKNPDARPSASDILARGPVKEVRTRPQTPRDVIQECGMKTKWGSHESTRDLTKILTTSSSGSSDSGLDMSSVRIPVDSLQLYRTRRSRDKPSSQKTKSIYANIKAAGGSKAKDKVTMKDPEATLRQSQEKPRPFVAWGTVADTLKGLSLSSMTSTDSGTSDWDSQKGDRDEFMQTQTEDLRSQCTSGLGSDVMTEAVTLLDSDMDLTQTRTSMMGLLGKERFARFCNTILYLQLFQSSLHPKH